MDDAEQGDHPFFNFMQQFRQQCKGMSDVQIAVEAARRWREMPQAERRRFIACCRGKCPKGKHTSKRSKTWCPFNEDERPYRCNHTPACNKSKKKKREECPPTKCPSPHGRPHLSSDNVKSESSCSDCEPKKKKCCKKPAPKCPKKKELNCCEIRKKMKCKDDDSEESTECDDEDDDDEGDTCENNCNPQTCDDALDSCGEPSRSCMYKTLSCDKNDSQSCETINKEKTVSPNKIDLNCRKRKHPPSCCSYTTCNTVEPTDHCSSSTTMCSSLARLRAAQVQNKVKMMDWALSSDSETEQSINDPESSTIM